MGFVIINSTIGFKFQLVNPLAAKDHTMDGRWNQMPSLSMLKSIKFLYAKLATILDIGQPRYRLRAQEVDLKNYSTNI